MMAASAALQDGYHCDFQRTFFLAIVHCSYHDRFCVDMRIVRDFLTTYMVRLANKLLHQAL